MVLSEDVVIAGVLRKKKSRLNTWVERYCVLRGQNLEYYIKPSDSEPKGTIILTPTSQVSKISSDVTKKRKQFVFRVSCRVEDEGDEIKEDQDNNLIAAENVSSGRDAKAKSGKKSGKAGGNDGGAGAKVAAVTVGGVMVGALTAGVGLLAGMMVVGMGAAAGGGAVAMSTNADFKEKSISLACDNYHEAEAWVNAIEAQIQESADSILGFPTIGKKRLPYRSAKQTPHPEVRIDEVEEWITSTRWKVNDIYEGIRILEPVSSAEDDQSYYESFFSGSRGKNVDVEIAPCLRINVSVNASATDAFSAISNFSSPLKAGIIQSMRVIQTIDNVTDIVHLKLHPLFLYPTWTAPRDFCLLRYWRDNSDGSYVICYDSTIHADCPPVEGYVRGELHSAYVIAPPKKSSGSSSMKDDEEEANECLISFIAEVDPKGWIWSYGGYQQKFLREFMLQVLDIRDALEADRFLQVNFDPIVEPTIKSAAGKDEGDSAEASIATVPPPVLPKSMWAESDATQFKVRGPTYNIDKVKTFSAPSLFKLLAVDLFEVDQPVSNIAAHPKNRVALAAQRGDPTWVFVVNIMVPGPPNLSFVAYFEGKKEVIEADTPFGRLARPFFYGNDDDLRNNRFKLIPRIIDGNMIIKMAVKDTPALIGNKLKNYYFKGDNYFELDVDVTSSSVARNVTGLAMGYSKTIVVDMGFCFQGDVEEELPEILIGGCTCIHVDASIAKKL